MDGFLAALRGKHLLPQLIAAVLLFSCGGEEDEGPPADPNAPPTAGEIQTSVSQVELDALGAKAQIVATVLDEEGFELEGIPLTWSSSAPAVAEVDKDGVVTARENGEATVSVRALGVTATVEVKVEQVARILVLQPKRVVFDAIGAAQELSAEVLDAGDHPVAAPIEWRSVDPDIATVDEQGRVVAHKAGKTEIAATVAGGELLGTVDVEVAPVPVRSGLRILVPPQFVSEAPTKVEVQITDREGHPVENGDFSVTLALGENPAGGRLSGTLTAKAVKGVATFQGLRIDKAAPGYTLVAQATGLDLGESVPFDVVPGAAARLQLLSQPNRVVSLQPFSPALRFEVVDSAGNRVNGTQEVQLSLAKGAEALLGGTTTVRAVAGIATFDKVHLDKAGRGYVLRAAASGLEAAESGAIEVAPGLASQLAFLVEPASTSAGKVLAPAVQVEVLDEAGNRVEEDARSVSLVLAPHASGAQLAGTNTQATVNGVAAFADLVVDRAGTGLVLVAASPGMDEVSSLPFDVGAGAPARLVFHLQPGNGVSGSALPSFEVRAVDATGTFTPEASGVVSITQGQGPEGAQLSGVRIVALQNGRAVFNDVRIDKAGTGYTLYATADSLSRGESSPFRVDPGAPASLAFLTEPTSVGSLAPMAPAPQVEILDAAGNRTTSTANVTLQLASNPWGGSLVEAQTVAAVNGVATFPNLRINRAGTDYRLQPSAGALTGPSSAPFSVTAGQPQKLAFRVSPANVEAGVPFSPALEVVVQDAAGNQVSSSGQTVTISLAENPGNAELSGSTQSLTENGVALFPNLALDRVSAEAYVLLAEAEGLVEERSAPFYVRAGPATALAFHQQPSNGASGEALPEVEVRLLDAKGNWNQNAGGTVTLTLDPNPTGAALLGDRSVPVEQGRAVFTNLRIDKAGSGYGFRATSGSLQFALSETFAVAPGAPAGLAFVGAPGNAVSKQPIPSVQVEVRDAAGNRVLGATHSISIARSRGPAGTLSGQTTVDAVDGVATFDDLRLDLAGSGYALQASSGAWTSPESGLFAVAPGQGSKLAFRVHPGPGAVGIALSPAVEVEVLDEAGNRTTENGLEVRLAIEEGPADASLDGATSALTSNGVAVFSSLFLDKAGEGYRLAATGEGLTGAISNAFSLEPGSGNRLDFFVQPLDGQSGSALAAVQVRVLDAGGNPTSNASGTVTISLAENPTNATLGGVTSASLVNGVATFSQLFVDKEGSGYALRATSDGYATATSDVFSIAPGDPAKLRFVQVPSFVTSGQAFLEPVLVEVVDAAGNRTGASTTVQLSLEQKPRADVLEGVLESQAVNGLASFPGLKLHLAAKGYTLRAEADGLAEGFSSEIEVVAGPAAGIAFATEPSDGVAGEALPAVWVEFLDAAGNRVHGRADEVTLNLASGPGTLGGVRTVAAEEGVAIFEQLRIERTGTYTLEATSGDMTSPVSAEFTVSAAAAQKLAFRVQPSDTYPNFAIRPEVEVEVQDFYGNRVPTAGDPVTITLENNPTGALLDGVTTVNAIEGVAPFGNLLLDTLGQGYTLRASSGALDPAESVIFDVVQSKATTLAFVTQPQDTPAGELLNPIQVEILDENEMRLDANLPISISLASAPEGGTLGGTLTVYAVNGLATFGNLAITKTGPGYSLKAQLNDIVAFSDGFEILSGAPKGVVWTQPPRDTVSGQVIFGQTQNYVGVEIVDMFGERVTNYNGEVTISVGAGPTGAYLQGILTTMASNGIALFPGLSIDRAGTYRLLVLPEEVPPSLSPSFEIFPGNSSRMRFLDTLSGSFPAGEKLPPLRVAIEDAAGNRTNTSQTLTLRALGGAGNVQLEGNPTMDAQEGLVTFDDISILQAGGYHLAVEGFGLTAVNGSGVFVVEAGEPAHMSFARQPASGKAKAVLPPVEVVLLDSYQNQTSSTQDVTLELEGGSPGAVLSGTTTRSATNGKVVFDDLEISAAGTGYKLRALTGGGVPSLASNSFEVFGGVPHSLQWSAFPAAGVSGEELNPAVVVRVVDEFGETVESFDGMVELSVASGPAGGALHGNKQVQAVAGVASFEALHLDRVGAYTLRAEAPSLAAVPALLSASLPIVAGSPAHLVFQSGPFNARSLEAMAPAVEVAILDAAGNLVEDALDQVVLRLEGDDAPGAFLFNETATPVDGIATFDGLEVDKVGSYMLVASIGALDSLPSREFRVHAGEAHEVRFLEQPQDHEVGGEFSVTVRFYDQAENEASGNHLVSLQLQGGDPSAALGGLTSKAASNGIASFDSLSIDTMGEGYALKAEAPGLVPDTSDLFRVKAGAPVALVWLGAPEDSQAGENLGPIQFEVVDAFSNRVDDYEEELTLTLSGAGGTLQGDTVLQFQGGFATAAQLSVQEAGTGYRILAETADFGPVASSSFSIFPGPVDGLAFVSSPGGGFAGTTLPKVTVAAVDAFNNPVTQSIEVTLSLAGGDPEAVLAGSLVRATTDGLATFSNLSIDREGEDYLLMAEAPGVDAVPSAPFSVQTGCAGGLQRCGEECVDTMSDLAHCGGCDVACEGDATCEAGNCTLECAPGMEVCNGFCVDLQSDPSSCGSCGLACDSGEICLSGQCVIEPDWHVANWPLPAEMPHRYQVEDLTVKDQVTGLTWQREAPIAQANRVSAASYCANLKLDGKEDWRLPTVIELLTLVDASRVWPAFGSVFPDQVGASWSSNVRGYFWSNTPYAANAHYWIVNFETGGAGTDNATNWHWVRCVRGGSGNNQERYAIANHIVRDNKTKLTWQRRSFADTFTQAEAAQACRDLNLEGYSDWRLPTKLELESLVDWRFVSPSIDREAFLDTLNEDYWTSTAYPLHALENYWRVSFNTGASGASPPDRKIRLRCVRDDEPPVQVCGERGQAPCGGVCVSIWDDPANCGACGNVCDAGLFCSDGRCSEEPNFEWATWEIPPELSSEYDEGLDTVRDRITGLVWQRSGTNLVLSLQDAKAYCKNLRLEQKTDWRLPSAIELLSIVDATAGSAPYINRSAFQNTYSGRYWTMSRRSRSDSYWYVDFAGASSGTAGVTTQYYVRCVRGGTPVPPGERYIIDDDVVYDIYTKLTWQRFPTTAGMTRTQANAYCTNLTFLGHRDWRLPTKKELESLVDRRRTDPGTSIDWIAFPHTVHWNYWAEGPTSGWRGYVAFSSGGSGLTDTTSSSHYYPVRCVRDDRQPAPTCESGETLCNNSCIDTDGDRWHCGGCGNVCADTEVCSAGSCVQIDNNRAKWPVPPDDPVYNEADPLLSDYHIDPEVPVVVDVHTGLTWQRTQTVRPMTHQQATQYCHSLSYAGYSDWRLPSLLEMISMQTRARRWPAFNTSAFTGAPTGSGDHWWTSTPTAWDPNIIQVGHADGGNYYIDRNSTAWVRCVRGGSVADAQPWQISEHYAVDPNTSLMWSRTYAGVYNYSAAANYCASFEPEPGLTGWRVPTRKEIYTFTDHRRSAPAFDEDLFGPFIQSSYFWTSSVWVGDTGQNWRLTFDGGTSSTLRTNTSTNMYVRCVRELSP